MPLFAGVTLFWGIKCNMCQLGSIFEVDGHGWVALLSDPPPPPPTGTVSRPNMPALRLKENESLERYIYMNRKVCLCNYVMITG